MGSKPVTCEDRGKHRYRRMIDKCAAGGLDLGAELIENGLAMPYWRYGGDSLW